MDVILLIKTFKYSHWFNTYLTIKAIFAFLYNYGNMFNENNPWSTTAGGIFAIIFIPWATFEHKMWFEGQVGYICSWCLYSVSCVLSHWTCWYSINTNIISEICIQNRTAQPRILLLLIERKILGPVIMPLAFLLLSRTKRLFSQQDITPTANYNQQLDLLCVDII